RHTKGAFRPLQEAVNRGACRRFFSRAAAIFCRPPRAFRPSPSASKKIIPRRGHQQSQDAA
ncbi:unnamed protein product, partial [Amoebophrya sp. A25]